MSGDLFSFATLSNWFSTVGLLLDMAGVILLFFYQVERHPGLRPDGMATTFAPEDDSDNSFSKKYKKYLRRTNFGIYCLVVGFSLQIVATWV